MFRYRRVEELRLGCGGGEGLFYFCVEAAARCSDSLNVRNGFCTHTV